MFSRIYFLDVFLLVKTVQIYDQMVNISPIVNKIGVVIINILVNIIEEVEKINKISKAKKITPTVKKVMAPILIIFGKKVCIKLRS